MLITVKDVLDLNGFKEAKIVAGKKGLSNFVTNPTLMEVPDIYSYVDVNSLLITTLYPIYNNEEAVRELIPKLAKLKIAGICIKPGRYVEEIPILMIEQANKLDFPIIELPKDSNLSSLVTEILELSLSKHIDILNFRNYVHQRLMDLFLKGENINTLVNHLSEMVGFPILLLDKDFNIIYRSRDLDEKETSLLSSFTNGINNFIIKVKDKSYNEEAYIKYPINAGQTKFGYIVLLKGKSKSRNLLVAVEQAALLIASLFYKNYAVLEKERSFQDSFIRDILHRKIDSPIDTINRAKDFGWNMEFPQVIIIIRLITEDDKMKKELYKDLLDSNFIEKTLEQEMSINPAKVKTVYIDDSLVVFLNVIFMNNIKESSIEIGEIILKNLHNSTKVGIGISNTANDIHSFSLAYKEAKNSVVVGSILNKGSFISHYGDHEMFNIIKEVKDADILSKYRNNKLGKILEYDKTTDMNLMETLRVLIEENMNAKRAAEKLFIHYNTLRYRIERIKELGINLEDGFGIGELVLAYNIHLWITANEN